MGASRKTPFFLGLFEDGLYFSEALIEGVAGLCSLFFALMVQPPPARHERRDNVKTSSLCPG